MYDTQPQLTIQCTRAHSSMHAISHLVVPPISEPDLVLAVLRQRIIVALFMLMMQGCVWVVLDKDVGGDGSS